MSNTREQKYILMVVLLTSFMCTFSGNALNLSIPAIEADFGVSAKAVGWVITLYTLVCAAAAVPFGKLADIVDRKKIFCTGLVIFNIAALLSVFSWNLTVLLTLRAIQGIGSSMIFATNMAILIAAFDPRERGRVLGISSCATYVGLSSGPVIGGVLNQHFGWQSIMIVTVLIGLVCIYIGTTKVPKQGSKKIEGFDGKGTILFCLGITALMYGISVINWVIIVIGVILSVLFIFTELNVDDPVVKMQLFTKSKAFLCSNLAALMNYSATSAITYMMSMYLQMAKGFSSQSAGLILITAPLIQAILSPGAGKLSDRYSPFKMASIGMAVCTLALGILYFIDVDTSMAYIVFALVVVGVGFAIFAAPNTSAVMGQVDKADYGIASSILATMRNIGFTVAMAIVTLIVGIFMGSQGMNQASPELLLSTIRTCILVFMGISVVGIFVSIKRD
ncbi:MAG: MFS transporter [Clostridia bacterium]|nr:MFS transporter [Clostridia bacterium]